MEPEMKKRMSWAAAGLILLLMTALQFVLDLGFSSTFRNEVGSIHSDFWLIIVPSDLVAHTTGQVLKGIKSNEVEFLIRRPGCRIK
jgi:hypothetical protein